MDHGYAILQAAIFKRFTGKQSWTSIAEEHVIGVGVLRRAYAAWARNYPEAQPVDSNDIDIDRRNRGRPTALTADEEIIVAEAVLYYADNCTPLTRQGLRDLVKDFVTALPQSRQDEIGFFNNRPSNNWVTAFLRRNALEIQRVALIEDKRAKAVTAEHLTEHFERVRAAMSRYNISKADYIFNTDQSGASFSKMKGRSLRKGIGAAGVRLLQKALTTKGSLDRVTIMSVVSASGVAYKPAIVFPGKLAHYRRVNGDIHSLHSVLPPCYLFQRNPPGVDTAIVFEWAKGFVAETQHLRKNGQHLVLLLDGYGSHIQYKTLKLFKDNNVIVLALPAHTSHVTQPLDVSVFASYKAHLQRELHNAARQKTILNAFDVGQCIWDAYASSHTAPNIRSGFHRTGIWDRELLRPNFSPLEKYLLDTNARKVSTMKVKELLLRFSRMHRTLLRDAMVEEEGHIRVDTTCGAHLTAEAVLDGIKKRHEARRKKEKEAERRVIAAAYKEPKADIARLIALAPERAIRRKRLLQTRASRRARCRARAAVLRVVVYVAEGQDTMEE